MYDAMQHMRGADPQRRDMPCLRGPYRQTRHTDSTRVRHLAAVAIQTFGLSLFVAGISAIGSEDLTACLIAAAVTAVGAGITALGARMGGRE